MGIPRNGKISSAELIESEHYEFVGVSPCIQF